MFGMSFTEILIVAVIAVLFLGPDKLPTALVQVAKFFKSFKSSINEAKSTFEQEVKLQELREDSLKYKKQLERGAAEVRKKLTFEELEELKEAKANVNKTLNDIKEDLDASSAFDAPKKEADPAVASKPPEENSKETPNLTKESNA
ncbi:Sec-independent protein translocase subunit TatB [Sulfurospirillum sp. T05]|uniref:Sec-independent protein translocase protein TatB homolog n=1 Tax=Sulfurospirillum tamanense TaxID=2813362 RepID=A0ABS2WQ89_9BACT|nr:Sec-independent protein translocase protein TatB [Sulfurospirillum tamanensis]MBN2963787.1 Sec-independent protein translocase subunit TatB [Sulfurospirillum tamanensis]